MYRKFEMKKKVLIATVISLILVVGILVFGYFQGWFYRANEQQVRFMTEINEANAIIWYYGNLDPGKEITLNYKKVTEFTDETIGDSNNEYAYHAIVIFDFDGKMDVSNEELLLIKEYCETKHYDMLYYGTAHFEQFRECGFFTTLSDECGFTYNGSYWINRSGKESYLNPYLLTGNWTESDNECFNTKDKHMMWKFVIQFIVDLVNSSNGELY